MLSKEEIEKEDREHIKQVLSEYKSYIFEFDTDNIKVKDVLKYIEQLETDKQKLIEKLKVFLHKGVEKTSNYVIELFNGKSIGKYMVLTKQDLQELVDLVKGEKK